MHKTDQITKILGNTGVKAASVDKLLQLTSRCAPVLHKIAFIGASTA
jgi:hypothetical protein